MKTELKQAITKLEEVRDGDMDIVKVNSKAAVEEFKKSFELQEFLNTYYMGSFNMAYNDMREYLEVKHPNLDRSFINIV